MARQAVVDAVEGYLAANWSAVPVFGENTRGVTPADGSPYVMIQYPFARSEQISIGAPGSNVWRDEGAFRLVLYFERGRGTKQARQWLDQMADLFRGKDLTVLQAHAPSVPVTDDRAEAGVYWAMSVSVPYTHDYYA